MMAFSASGISRVSVVAVLLVALGCSRTPRVTVPNIDSESAADEALALYDADGNGSLNRSELTKSPALLARLEAYDLDSSGTIERQELQDRIQDLLQDKAGLTRLRCQVTYKGAPFPDAVVVFEPETYLGDEIKPASGVTDRTGLATIHIADEHLSEMERKLKPLHYGTYKVRITHPKVNLPPKYNTQTELGYETEVGNPFVTFALK